MTKRIFQSICFAALGVFAASVLLFMGVLYEHYTGVQRSQLRMQTELAAQGTANEGLKYFDGLDVKFYRITWIDTDGSVLYDSQSDSGGMENHLEREEIKQAVSEGMGESSRYSVTLMERAVYCAKRLPDGTVLRLSYAAFGDAPADMYYICGGFGIIAPAGLSSVKKYCEAFEQAGSE